MFAKLFRINTYRKQGEYNASFNPQNQTPELAAETSLLICQIGADRLAPRLETCDNLAVILSADIMIGCWRTV
jgi:hypothetical protein